MKRMIYQVYVGKSSRLYDWCTESVRVYADSIGADYVIQKEPILRIRPNPFTSNRSPESYEKHGGFLPIYEKENAFDYFDRYDQIAIIDADIYIRPNSPSIFDEVGTDVDFGGVIERHMPVTQAYGNKIKNYSKMQYGQPPIRNLFAWDNNLGADFYNMGMMVCNKSMQKYLNGMSALEFISQPKYAPFIDGLGAWKWSTDQTLLNYWVKVERMSVKNLSYHWNALYTAIDITKIKDAHFVHFFLKDKLPNRGENVEELQKHI